MTAANLFDRIYPSERAARVAVVYEQRAITYEELGAATVRAAEVLHALGVSEGDRVAILLNDSPEFIASFVAAISIGAIAVPINMALRKGDQVFILKDCGARAAIVEAAAAETIFQPADEGSEPAAENLLQHKNHDLWSINADDDNYQEAASLAETGLVQTPAAVS